MSRSRPSMLLLGLTAAALAMYLGLSAPVSADDCASRITNFGGFLALPNAVVEDCMRTGWLQALLTAILGVIGGGLLARQAVKGHGGQRRRRELPAVSKKGLIDLVNKNEAVRKVPYYHEGAKKLIEKALKEVQAEIDKLGGLDQNSPEAEKLRVRLSALLWALSQTLDPNNKYKLGVISPSLSGSVAAYPAGDEDDPKRQFYKCNKLVADAYAYGAGIGLETKNPKGFPSDDGVWAPQANDIARADNPLRNFTTARDYHEPGTTGVDPRSIPQPGDIVSYQAHDGLGHTTIYLGNGLVVGAKADEGATIEVLDSEMEDHGATRVRKYTASGKK